MINERIVITMPSGLSRSAMIDRAASILTREVPFEARYPHRNSNHDRSYTLRLEERLRIHNGTIRLVYRAEKWVEKS